MANPENKQIPYESTQKDIRDAIESVATAIGGIAIPSADHVSYDNSGSGLSATDVQNALDEIVSDIPTVNNGTLTIQQNGTSKGSFTANSASNVNVNIETPTADKKTATDQFTTADGGLLSKCVIDLVPIQSGSGDPSPDNVRAISGHTSAELWNVGKNLVSGIENGSWNSNRTKNDTAPQRARTKEIFIINPSSQVYLNLIPTNGKYIDVIIHGFTDSVSAKAWETSWTRVPSSFNIPNNIRYIDIIFRTSDSANNPEDYITNIQLEYGNQATTFEPYNPSSHLYQVQIGSTVYGGYVDLVSGVMIPNIAKKVVSANDITNSSGVFVGRHFTNANYIPNPETARLSFWCNAYKAISASSSEEVGEVYISASGQLIFNTMYADINDFKTWINNNELYICYQIENPTPIQLTPQQIETLVGQNNLSTPLSGQSIETNGVEYKELFTFADVKEYVDKKIPDAPTTDGTYTLQAVVSGGVPTYSWV